MELQLYLDILKRRALVIVIVVVVAILVVAAAGFLIPPVYEAKATVRVLLDVGVTDLILREDHNKRLLNTYAAVSKSEPVLDKALTRLLPRTSSLKISDFREDVEVEVVPDTELISISVRSSDPALARDLANALATLLMEYAQDLYVGGSKSTRQIVEDQLASMENDLDEGRQQLAALLAANASDSEIEALSREIEFKEDAYDRLLDRYELARLNESLRANSITVVAPATLPNEPANTPQLSQIGLALVVGLFGGVGLALVMENLDTRIHSPQQLEYLLNLPVLGSVPKGLLSVESLGSDKRSADSQAIAEAYRLLGINLMAFRGHMSEGEKVSLQTILITSAVPDEGKSTVTANLALAFAERGQAVFLVESDLRRPSIAEMFAVENDLGLSTLLAERAPIDDAMLGKVIHPTEQPSLFVISGGPVMSNPTALLASPSMEHLVDYLGTQGQVTLMDAPPVLGMADASVLASKVDGIILVVRQAFSTRDQVRAALKQLQTSHAHVLGTVFVNKTGSSNGIYG